MKELESAVGGFTFGTTVEHAFYPPTPVGSIAHTPPAGFEPADSSPRLVERFSDVIRRLWASETVRDGARELA
jgi:hypothetical protein